MSESKEVSDEYILAHDSRLQVGGVTFIVHVHSGLETCDDCEPGLIIQKSKELCESSAPAAKEDLQKARKRELKKIRQRFGLKLHEPDDSNIQLKPGYQDRAEERRKTVGIDPLGAKTEVASASVPIAKKNKGFQMLAKMGWNEGKSLGKNESSDAITEPVTTSSWNQNVGGFITFLFSMLLDLGGYACWQGRFRCRNRPGNTY